jgi:hypothetical protein
MKLGDFMTPARVIRRSGSRYSQFFFTFLKIYKMSTSKKLLLGLFSLLPMLSLAIYFVAFFSFFITAIRSSHDPDVFPQLMLEHLGSIIAVALLMVISKLGTLIYFLIHAVNNRVVDSTERIVWILVFIFAGMIGFPVYWYMRIWKEPQALS